MFQIFFCIWLFFNTLPNTLLFLIQATISLCSFCETFYIECWVFIKKLNIKTVNIWIQDIQIPDTFENWTYLCPVIEWSPSCFYHSPFDNWTQIDHLKSGLVRYSDIYCNYNSSWMAEFVNVMLDWVLSFLNKYMQSTLKPTTKLVLPILLSCITYSKSRRIT
jgi:hypothetical protein